MLQVLISTQDATRIQTTGGAATLKYFASTIGTSINGQRYFWSVWVKNNGLAPIFVTGNVAGVRSAAIPADGKWRLIQFSAFGDGVGQVQFRFETTNIGDALDATAWNPVIRRSQFPVENLAVATGTDSKFVTNWGIFSGAVQTITQGQTKTFDYTKYVESSSLAVEDKLNQPSDCSFNLVNIDDVFVLPPREAYVQIFSVQFNKYEFTGFISADIARDFIGLNSNTPSMNFQTYRHTIKANGDEALLGSKAVQFLPPFVNLGAGQILALLANTLAPNFFDVTSQCASGDVVPYFEYDPSKTWVDIAKTFADQYRFRVRILNKVLFYQPWGDQPLPIKYDETAGSRSFDPMGLKTTIFDATVVNDAIVIGDVEAGTNHDDYFIGDGFTSAFPLRHKIFDGESSEILSEDWTSAGGSVNQNIWFENDPSNAIVLAGLLNVNGGLGFNLTYLYAKSAIDMAAKVILEHGQLNFVGNCSGAIVGGIYDTTFLAASACEAGFDIRPAPGLNIFVNSVSGVSGLQIQPMRFGQLIGQPVITQLNHLYTLTTIINGRQFNLFTSNFKTFSGAIIPGNTRTGIADITWLINDLDLTSGLIDLNTGAILAAGKSVDTRFTLQNAVVPSFCIYGLLNIQNANFTLTFTSISFPPQGTLNVVSLSGASATMMPVLPSKLGAPLDYALGFGVGDQTATIQGSQQGGGTDTSVLDFYRDTIPGVGARIRLQTWEAQTSVSRVQDPVSIAKEASIVGDDGLRTQIFHDFKPIPRTSDECELAGKAILADRGTTIYQGSYSVREPFFDFINNDFARSGRFLTINSPQRGINNIKVNVNSVKTEYVEMFSEQKLVTLSFGPSKFLDNQLALFTPRPANLLFPKDTAQAPTALQLANVGTTFLPGVDNALVLGAISGSGCLIDAGTFPNYFIATESFDNAVWVQTLVGGAGVATITPNATVAPNGQLTADQIAFPATISTASTRINQTATIPVPSVGSNYTFSIWLRANVAQTIFIFLKKDNASGTTTGPVVQCNVTTAWQQFSVTGDASSNASQSLLAVISQLGSSPGATVFAWGAQLEKGSVVNPYVPVGTSRLLFEVRATDFGWNTNARDLIGRFSTQQFGLIRGNFDQTWYIRLVDGTKFSRYSKVIRIMYPQTPSAPSVDAADSSVIQGNFSGDIRNIYGVELRGPDNTSILAQRPVGSNLDMYFDLKKLNAAKFWASPNMLLYTEDFDNPNGWQTTSASVSGNAALDPNGFGPTADLISIAPKGAGVFAGVIQFPPPVKTLPGQNPNLLDGRTFTFSTWLRVSGGSQSFELGLTDNPFTNIFAGVLAVNVTSAWQRFSVTATVPAGASQALQVQIRALAGIATGALAVFAWGAQLEEGTTPSAYFANVDNYGPRNLLMATEEFDNQDFWIRTTTPSVTGGFIQYGVPFTKQGIVTQGTVFTASNCLDDAGNCLDSVALGSSLNFAGSTFAFGAPNTNNVMACNGQQLPVPSDYYSSIRLIGSGQGFAPSLSGSFTANYADGTSQVFQQLFTQWAVAGNMPNESTAITMGVIDQTNGAQLVINVRQFHYQFNLDPTKRLINITCPANRGICILAINLFPIKYQAIVVPNAVVDPVGNLTADQINFAPNPGTGSQIMQVVRPPAAKNKTFTFSVWLRTSGANVGAGLAIQDFPFTMNANSPGITITNQWQRFVTTGTLTGGVNPTVNVIIFNPNNAAMMLYAWGAQLEYADGPTLYLGNGNVVRPFFLYFFNEMWEYSPATVVQIGSPSAPIVTLGSKLANSIDVRLDRLNRPDIKLTTLQLSTDGNFNVGSSINVTGEGQPASFSMNVSNVALSAFYVRTRRKDFFSDGAWSSVSFIPYGTIIGSSWAGGQGSIPPALDNQTSSLFTATATAIAGGGANTGRIVLSWPTFIITFPDQIQQVVLAGSFDTGQVLSSTVGVATPYVFYPRLRAQVPGVIPEFINGAHSQATVADAQICQADGYLPLGGSNLGMTINVPAANAIGGGTSSGGGTGGGSKCIPEDEVVTTHEGDLDTLEVMLKHMILGADPDTKELHWNKMDSLGYDEALCVEIECEDGSKGKCSVDTELPIWTSEDTYSYVKPLRIKGNSFMLSKKGSLHLTRIKSITQLGMRRVVKMTVSPWHTIFSRDLLTHNAVLPK